MTLPTPTEIMAAIVARAELPPDRGEQGKAGEIGPIGPQGIEGPRGPKGNDGATGNPGSMGPKGDPGPVGPKGDKGEKGDKGDKGDDGERGPQGIPGPRGRSVKGLFGGGGGGSSSSGGGAVDSVNGETGVVVISSAEVPFTPAGTISATNVQAAIEEVAAEASGLPPQWTDGGNGNVTATVDDVAATPVTLQAMVGQTGYLFRAYDENGDLHVDIDSVGVLDATTIAVQTPPDTGDLAVGAVTLSSLPNPSVVVRAGASVSAGALLFAARSGNDGFYQIKKPGLGSDNGYVEFLQLNNADTMFLMSAAAAPSSDHFQIWNFNFDAKLFRITKAGAPGTSATAVADAELAAGEVAFYFDPTNGAATPVWKGKSADGTVVSGSLGGGGSITPAVDPGDIADPTLATPESNALKINTFFANMRTAGLLA